MASPVERDGILDGCLDRDIANDPPKYFGVGLMKLIEERLFTIADSCSGKVSCILQIY